MTAAMNSSAGSATPGTVSTTDPGAAASGTGAGSAGNASGSQDSGSGDYLEKVRAGGDFAAQEVRSHQSRADKAEAQAKKLSEWMGPLEGHMQSFTGEQAYGHLNDYNNILENPEARAAIERLRSGGSEPTSTTTSTDTDDEYLTDEQKEIRQLRSELSSVNSRLGQTEFADGQQALNKHMEQIRKDYGLSDEVFTKAKEATAAQIVQWRTSGGESGRKAIESLKTANGKLVVAGIMLPAIGPDGLLDAQQNRDRRTSERLSALGTDGPSEHASTGREPPPKFTGPNAVQEASDWARRNPDGHNSM